MRLRHATAALIVTLTLGFTACEPSQEQQDCEAAGGTWTRARDGTTIILAGKTPILVPR